MVELTIDGIKVDAPEGSMVMQAAHKAGYCRQLPHVPGGRGKSAQAVARLRHARDQRHGRPHLLREGPRRSEVGRRVRAAGRVAGLWRLFLALPGRKARSLPQGSGPAGRHRDDPLHPVHPLRPLRPGSRRRHGTGHAGPRRARRDHDLRRPLGRVRTVGQHDRHLSGGRADLQALPLQRPHLGTGSPPFGQPARQPGRQPGGPGQGRPRHARGSVRRRSRQRVLAVRP
uniref:Ald_Xan_dh_C2 domain-containing protein n=1 Tax=Parastrongyloides trichosuri TaxID=131310 RepID=A0A0N4ZLE4_PARTI